MFRLPGVPTADELLSDEGERVPSKFDAIGLSQLKIRSKTTSIPGSLFQRELGIGFQRHTNRDGRWLDSQINRQLLAARGPKTNAKCAHPTLLIQDGKNNTPKSNVARSRVWTVMSLATFQFHILASRKAKCYFVYDKLMIEETYDSLTVRSFLSINPTPGSQYHLDYKIGTTKKWGAFGVWYIDPSVRNLKDSHCRIVTVSNTLVALENHKILLFDINNGTHLSELSLPIERDSHDMCLPKYKRLGFDHEKGWIFVEGSKSSVAKLNLLYQGLILSYPPLVLLYRIQIPNNNIIGKGYVFATKIGTIGSMFHIFKTNTVEVLNFDKILNKVLGENTGTNTIKSSSSDYTTIVINQVKRSDVLLTLNTKHNFLMVVPRITPPHFLTINKESFEIYNLQHPDIKLASIPRDSEASIRSYCSFPNLIYAGLPDGFEIFQVADVEPGSSFENSIRMPTTCLRSLFNTKDFIGNFKSTLDLKQDSQDARNARGLRNIPRQYYGEISKENIYGLAYNRMMNLFAVCIISNSTYVLDITLFDHFTMKKFKKLQPVQLIVPKSANCIYFVSHMEVNFQNAFLSVKVFNYLNFSQNEVEIYTINLLSDGTRTT